MAQKTSTKPKTGTNTSARRKNSSSKKTQTQVAPAKSVSGADYFHAFTKTRFFKILLSVFIIAAIIGLNLLISWNNFDRFFLILGIELIVSIIVWSVKVFVDSSKESKSNSSQGASV